MHSAPLALSDLQGSPAAKALAFCWCVWESPRLDSIPWGREKNKLQMKPWPAGATEAKTRWLTATPSRPKWAGTIVNELGVVTGEGAMVMSGWERLGVI